MQIQPATIDYVDRFLKKSRKSQKTFTYFYRRSIKVIENHIVTLIGIIDDQPVIYGHLDPENDKTWLGICVADNQHGKGYGKLMMAALIKQARINKINKITLSVHNSNVNAIFLYEKFGFKMIKEDDVNKYMERII